MDPIILTVLGIVLVLIILRIFFGLAKTFLKVAFLIVVAVIIWRVFFVV